MSNAYLTEQSSATSLHWLWFSLGLCESVFHSSSWRNVGYPTFFGVKTSCFFFASSVQKTWDQSFPLFLYLQTSCGTRATAAATQPKDSLWIFWRDRVFWSPGSSICGACCVYSGMSTTPRGRWWKPELIIMVGIPLGILLVWLGAGLINKVILEWGLKTVSWRCPLA